MIREEIILHREYIEKLGQQKHFQVKLPIDVKRIIGIETGVFRYASSNSIFGGNPAEDPQSDPLDPLFKISFNDPIGKLTLQTQDFPGIIYQADVRQTEKNFKWADFTQTLYDGLFDQYSHDKNRFENTIAVDLCKQVIEGHYRDSWGEHQSYHIEYELLIYLWIEKKV
jgi:hypothetical protein